MKCAINLACVVDANYAAHLATAMRSLACSNRDRLIKIHVLHDSVPDKTRKQVENSAKSVEFIWYPVVNHKTLEFTPFLQISRAAYMRLAAPEILPQELLRVLYIDVDLIINGCIDELWQTNLNGMPCAAVADPGKDPAAFAIKHGLEGGGAYFNSGVMLLDLKLLRENGTFQRAIDWTAARNTIESADQDALNVVLWRNWVPLDQKWNFQRKHLYLGRRHPRPVIVHFTEQVKPWQKAEWHPYAWLYLKTLMKTEFRTSVLRSNGIGPVLILKRFLKYLAKT
jgi:lipopolysaccharide biosynthesis glycosyltransferase